jgi:beta-N-acetylhexosaminidase
MGENLKTKLYRMFILGLDGENLSDNPNLINALHDGLGGVIFFTQNIQTSEQFKKLVKDIKKENQMPLFLSIDQEGGRVERTENIFNGKKFLSGSKCIYKGEKILREQTEQISHLLKDFGLNLNFAPVLDVNTNPDNPIIGERAFSDNPDEVIKYGKIVVETYLKNGIMPCTKHFPGHGDANVDSHFALPKIDLPLDEMEKIHIKPFKEVTSPMIMVAHLHCTAFDKNEIPSSLSKNVISYLREKMGYRGLVITDDMVMGAVEMQRGNDAKMQSLSHALQAIKAGVNLLLYRNSANKTIQIIENLAKIAETDEELRVNIEQSYEKIVSS